VVFFRNAGGIPIRTASGFSGSGFKVFCTEFVKKVKYFNFFFDFATHSFSFNYALLTRA
jgi:hypothetical protein